MCDLNSFSSTGVRSTTNTQHQMTVVRTVFSRLHSTYLPSCSLISNRTPLSCPAISIKTRPMADNGSEALNSTLTPKAHGTARNSQLQSTDSTPTRHGQRQRRPANQRALNKYTQRNSNRTKSRLPLPGLPSGSQVSTSTTGSNSHSHCRRSACVCFSGKIAGFRRKSYDDDAPGTPP